MSVDRTGGRQCDIAEVQQCSLLLHTLLHRRRNTIIREECSKYCNFTTMRTVLQQSSSHRAEPQLKCSYNFRNKKTWITWETLNQAANIANFEWSVDVSGPKSAIIKRHRATTLTHGTAAQWLSTSTEKRCRNVISSIAEREPIHRLRHRLHADPEAFGLPYTTTPDTTNYDLVSATPTGHTGGYPPAGNDITVTRVQTCKNAGNITVSHCRSEESTQHIHRQEQRMRCGKFQRNGSLDLVSLTNKAAKHQ